VVSITVTRPPGMNGITGEGTLMTLVLKVVGSGDSALELVKLGATDSKHASIPAAGVPAVVHVR
jgi:general secretion pathway protein D